MDRKERDWESAMAESQMVVALLLKNLLCIAQRLPLPARKGRGH